MIRKIVGFVLAAVLALGCSVSVFADTTADINADGGSQAINVNAKYAPDDTVSVSIAWGDMNFTYSDKSPATWTADSNSNRVIVDNNSPHVSIRPTYSYSKESTWDFWGVGLFSTETHSFEIGSPTGATFDSLANGATVTGNTLGTSSPGDTETRYLMFTTAGSTDLTSSYQKVGTLTVTVNTAS